MSPIPGLQPSTAHTDLDDQPSEHIIFLFFPNFVFFLSFFGCEDSFFLYIFMPFFLSDHATLTHYSFEVPQKISPSLGFLFVRFSSPFIQLRYIPFRPLSHIQTSANLHCGLILRYPVRFFQGFPPFPVLPKCCPL